MKLFKNEAVDKVTDFYLSKDGGEVVLLKEASLACYGLAICLAPKFRFVVIKEVYLNEWSSGNSMRTYKVLPKKYQLLLEEYYNKE